MFLLYLLGCRTSLPLDFWSVLVVFCFEIVVLPLLVQGGGSVCAYASILAGTRVLLLSESRAGTPGPADTSSVL